MNKNEQRLFNEFGKGGNWQGETPKDENSFAERVMKILEDAETINY